MARIGAHVRGGIKGGVAHALEIQAETIQIFVGSPQTWRPAQLGPADVERFLEDVAAAQIDPVFVHGIYLINLAAERPDVYEKSVAALAHQLTCAGRVGAAGLIFHPGSAGSAPYEEALQRLVGGLERVLTEAEGSARVLLEVCAGQGQTIGVRFQQLADIIAGLGGDPRLAVCWDTCHLYSAGYDIASADGLERTLDEMDRVLGLERLLAVHANDSKNPLGANLDRHENIGQGTLGEAAFGRLLTHPVLEHLPFLLEVPGFDGNGPDLENIAILRRLAGRPLPLAAEPADRAALVEASPVAAG
jgi:deoxyribonuclease-4